MPRVKETGGDAALPKAAAVAAESRMAKKTAQMQAGQVLITEAAKHAAEVKEMGKRTGGQESGAERGQQQRPYRGKERYA